MFQMPYLPLMSSRRKGPWTSCSVKLISFKLIAYYIPADTVCIIGVTLALKERNVWRPYHSLPPWERASTTTSLRVTGLMYWGLTLLISATLSCLELHLHSTRSVWGEKISDAQRISQWLKGCCIRCILFTSQRRECFSYELFSLRYNNIRTPMSPESGIFLFSCTVKIKCKDHPSDQQMWPLYTSVL